MKKHDSIQIANELMSEFARRTGLASDQPISRRYLWTDAFAVCNFLELHRRTHTKHFLDSALTLVDAVHWTLGRHRPTELRAGWISGLGEEEGWQHPTRGGLRIGKKEGERTPDEPFDERREWDRDGQYFHYLTRWMHALERAGRVSGEERYLEWAIELARTAFAGFSYPAVGGKKLLYWKMSVDLSRPAVPSMGQHDALDGLLTFLALQAVSTNGSGLQAEILDLWSMCTDMEWATADPLGLGSLLCDSLRLAQLIARDEIDESGLLTDLLRSAVIGLAALSQQKLLQGSAEERLAFRELGLAIGLLAIERLEELWRREPDRLGRLNAAGFQLGELVRFIPEGERIRRFWLDPVNRSTTSWNDHLDINSVMLATSFVPEGYLAL